MNKATLRELNVEIDKLESDSKISWMEAEERLFRILLPLLHADGYSARSLPRSLDTAFDYLAEKPAGDRTSFTLGIQYKHRWRRPISFDEIASLIVRSQVHKIDRALLITNSKFSNRVLQQVAQIEKTFPTAVELLDLSSLRGWASRIERKLKGGYSKIVAAVVDLSKQCARWIADDPKGLDALEWRDMERMLAAVFEKLGFDVTLTEGSKDRGKDLVLLCTVRGRQRSYIVEVKHWRSGKRVGKRYVSDFVSVIAREQHAGGLYLATYGFSENAFEALTEVQRETLKLGAEKKIVSVCRSFVKAESGIWSAPSHLPDLLFEEGELLPPNN
ncbi:MAG TPA: restriction endonuclease [Pyrinomonadaceae bacterium]|nr:restriction endonuclease [Pyrinomonadaceae bacterium]